VWRTDLFATEPHWRSWFEGLSDAFLAAPGAKLLLLAGTGLFFLKSELFQFIVSQVGLQIDWINRF
jgi:hypothetical protein